MYYLYARINNLNLPIDLKLKLFDQTIVPILTYGCEVFGFENIQILERIHTEFLRTITKTKKSTPHYMLLAELGRYPLEITVKTRMVGFWSRIVSGKVTKLSYIMYKVMRHTPNLQSKWINHVKSIFEDSGRPDVWLNEGIGLPKCITQQIKRTLLDQNSQLWHENLQNSTKGTNYQLFKDSIKLEQYFLTLERKNYLPLVKFRTANHRLPVEVLRWEGVPHRERTCHLCDALDIADEFHYLLRCNHFAEERRNLIKPYYFRRPNILKYKELMNVTSSAKLNKLCQFIKVILKHFNS